MSVVSLKGICDLHIHTNPDLRKRAYTDFELADAAVRVGARAVLIKSHLGPTVNRAFLTNEYVKFRYGEGTHFTMYGGLVLNQSVGGINPDAVEKALKLGAKEIWLPTQSSQHNLKKLGKDPAQGVALLENGKVVPKLLEVFRMIKDYDAILGTGHASPEESFRVIEAARDLGLEKILVTHPEWWVIDMSVEDQVRLVQDYGVYLERCYAQNMKPENKNAAASGQTPYKYNFESNLEIIQKVGYQHVLISTDGGQTENPYWEFAMEEYLHYLIEHGVALEEIYYMTKTIPYRLLGIQEEAVGAAKE